MTTEHARALWDYARFITKHVRNQGKWAYAAIHGREEGECWASDPKDDSQFTKEEVKEMNKAFVDPSMLFSCGVVLRGVKFTFLKVEKNAILARTENMASIVMKTEKAFIVAVFPGDELMKPVFEHCSMIAEKLSRADL